MPETIRAGFCASTSSIAMFTQSVGRYRVCRLSLKHWRAAHARAKLNAAGRTPALRRLRASLPDLRWTTRRLQGALQSDGKLRVPWGYVGGVQCDPIEKKPFFHVHPGAHASASACSAAISIAPTARTGLPPRRCAIRRPSSHAARRRPRRSSPRCARRRRRQHVQRAADHERVGASPSSARPEPPDS